MVLPKILGPWWGPTKAVSHSVNADTVIILFAGGGDTWTQFCIIKLVSTFCAERWWGANNENLWSGKLVGQIHYTVIFFVRLLPHGKRTWGVDCSWRWWDTWPLFCIIEVVWTFCTERQSGAKNKNFPLGQPEHLGWHERSCPLARALVPLPERSCPNEPPGETFTTWYLTYLMFFYRRSSQFYGQEF